MVVASPYTVEEIAEKLKEVHSLLTEGKQKEYDVGLRSIVEDLEELLDKYPQDTEMKDYHDAFTAFYEKRSGGVTEVKRLLEFVSDIEHLAHWRKIAMASGKELPFRDYRSLRGERGRRG